MTASGPRMQGLRVLVVEDEAIISMLLEDMLTELGCTVVGPGGCVAEALAILERSDVAVDAALLDLDLGGEPSLPVADVLAARGVPFAFASGYGAEAAAGSRHAGVPVLAKPFTQATLAAMIEQLAR